MKIKWYWLAEQLGLMEYLSEGNGSSILYRVSAKADDFFVATFFALTPALFITGFFLSFLLCSCRRDILAGKLTRLGAGILMIYALLLATGIGPYIQFYPQSAGFIDFSGLEHILSGLYCAFLALMVGWAESLRFVAATDNAPRTKKMAPASFLSAGAIFMLSQSGSSAKDPDSVSVGSFCGLAHTSSS